MLMEPTLDFDDILFPVYRQMGTMQVLEVITGAKG